MVHFIRNRIGMGIDVKGLSGCASLRSHLGFLIALSSVLVPASGLAQATFTSLGLFGGTLSEAFDVSSDGTVVVGITRTVNGQDLFRWSTEGSEVRTGTFERFPSLSWDGLAIAGGYLRPNVQHEAFRWTVGGAFEGLGDLPGGGFSSTAFGISANGEVVVGVSTTATGDEAFRWTAATGMVGLGDLPGGANSSLAHDVSADGTTAVGYGHGTDSRAQAVRWTNTSGVTGLGFLPDADGSEARAVSGDGSVIVGNNQFLATPPDPSETTYQAFRWTAATGMTGLGDLPGGRVNSQAHDVSADGSVIVGVGETSFNGTLGIPEAFYWSTTSGMLNLRELLISLGATGLDGWSLREAHAVSADGRTIAGRGLHNGVGEAWVATIPEPSTLGLAAASSLGILALYFRRRVISQI